jgi:hypothetical protein
MMLDTDSAIHSAKGTRSHDLEFVVAARGRSQWVGFVPNSNWEFQGRFKETGGGEMIAVVMESEM